MSKYKILNTNPVIDTHEFFIDNLEDLAILPKEPASTALVANENSVYICNNSGEWVIFKRGSSN